METLHDILKVKTVSYLICNTNMGKLEKCYRKNDPNHYYTLDSVELDKETAKRLDAYLR